ncbi:putative bifunctional diguanylate cyclase/phosphodiesterase [Loktanella sp. Alg231-35]|uniref:putative bifunctional diguanylate cyclase/phosphodiesterase n=1 Tax=Loktanella sp. Alg231-35 TaxID=1922220 RepID=UPI001F24E69A|nr:EAL domain-containing protein [Loktanella sp. Alg231-35]
MRTTGRRRRVQLVLTSIIAGTTIWSTHFIAMLAYDPGVEHDYEPVQTVASLGLAVVGMFVSTTVLAQRNGRFTFVISGTVFGITIASVHFLGMSAFLLPGHLSWDGKMITVSVILGIVLGVGASHRIAQPATRHSWPGAAVMMGLAICTMHFTGMAAFDIVLDGTANVPEQVISDTTLAVLIIAVTSVILLIGFASFSIETDVQQQANSQLEHAALPDPMTGLPNRLSLDQTLKAYQSEHEGDPDVRVALLSIDVNNFKEVNDLYGHVTGDEVLKIIATRLSDGLQDNGFVARVDGDQFVVAGNRICNPAEVLTLAELALGLLVQPVETMPATIKLGASIGTAYSATDGPDLRALLQKSDLALQRAKKEPATTICAFDTEMDAQNRDRKLLARDMRSAIANGEFDLAYQFQNSIPSRAIVGFEALLRWKHPTRGPISPAEFIPIAEETGQIREIGLWVLRTACQEAATWHKPYSIAVNVAPQQLVQAGFVDKVSEILKATNLPPSRLELEITEASIINDKTHTIEAMHRLREMGIRIAMDDFGTGYSSLATLQAFPFDKIKIDKNFVQDLHKDKKHAAIVKATLLLAEAFDVPVLAEGVELEEELAFLHKINCGTAQGFYFGKPMHLPELHAALADAANADRTAYAS